MSSDQLVRYVFDELHVRGELVQLDVSYKAILENHDYPLPVKKLLGELMAATSLLTATLKFKGDIAIQIQGEGAIKYAVINGTDEQKMRGVARVLTKVNGDSLAQLFPRGYMVITITPEKGERYQGMVALEKESLAACLEDYFAQSEQLQTKIYLHSDEQKQLAAGMLLQVLPAKPMQQQDFEHLDALTATMTSEELFTLDATQVLHRLYHEEKVTLYTPQAIRFECTCSKQKCATAIRNIGHKEANSIVLEKGQIEISCDYCNTSYQFDSVDVESIFTDAFSGNHTLN